MKKVIMSANYNIKFSDGKNFEDLFNDKHVSSISAGGFGFVVDGHPINFDFDAATSWVESDGTVNFESGRGFLFNDYDISRDFDEVLEKEGLTNEDITAKFLAGVSKITEFYVNIEIDDEELDNTGTVMSIELIDITFYDENEAEYSVSKDVIDEFNKESLANVQ